MGGMRSDVCPFWVDGKIRHPSVLWLAQWSCTHPCKPTAPSLSVRWMKRFLGPGRQLIHEIVSGFLRMKCQPNASLTLNSYTSEKYTFTVWSQWKQVQMGLVLSSTPTFECGLWHFNPSIHTSSPYRYIFLPAYFPTITNLLHILEICWVRSPSSLIIPLSIMRNPLVL